MKFLKLIFLLFVVAQTTFSVWCYTKGVWGFMENIAFAIQIGFILLGLVLGLWGIKLISSPKTNGHQIAGWILFVVSVGFAVFMTIQNVKLILHPPHYPFG